MKFPSFFSCLCFQEITLGEALPLSGGLELGGTFVGFSYSQATSIQGSLPRMPQLQVPV